VEAHRLGDNKGLVLVILDSNMLISLTRGLADLRQVEEILEGRAEYATTEAVVEELSRLSRSRASLLARSASRALNLLRELGVKIFKDYTGDADDSIVSLALDLKARNYRVIVATNDRSLRRRLRRLGVPTAYYRESEGRLELDWEPL